MHHESIPTTSEAQACERVLPSLVLRPGFRWLRNPMTKSRNVFVDVIREQLQRIGLVPTVSVADVEDALRVASRRAADLFLDRQLLHAARRHLTFFVICYLALSTGCTSNVQETSTPSTPTGQSAATTARQPATIHYADGDSQFARLGLPPGMGPHKVVVLIHGGFWRSDYSLDLMDPLAIDLNSRGYATWNIEYRRVGEAGGGFPGTLVDVAAAVDHLASVAERYRLDLSAVTFVGHSSGGHLAMWAASRDAIAPGRPGAEPRVVPHLAIGLGPVFDLEAGAAEGLGNAAVTNFIGGPVEDYPVEFADASPSLGSTTPLVVVRGVDDDIVPRRFTEPSKPTPPGRVRFIDVPGDHFALIDPASIAWKATVDLIK